MNLGIFHPQYIDSGYLVGREGGGEGGGLGEGAGATSTSPKFDLFL